MTSPEELQKVKTSLSPINKPCQENKPKEPWWKTAKNWFCQECGTVNPMSSDVCSGCDCSLDGFVDDDWLYGELEE